MQHEDIGNITRTSSPYLDEILGKKFSVLDHGFIRVVDYMGNDTSVVQAARVSYGAGTRSVSDDSGLINYLLKHAHNTPFEMASIKLHVKLPIFVARQWIRHRTASVNEVSGRYSEMSNDYYLPELEDIKPQATKNKQGRDGNFSVKTQKKIQDFIRASSDLSYDNYQLLVEPCLLGDNTLTTEQEPLAKELARIVLPVNYYTEWYWKTDLRNLLAFLKLRTDSHAQFEVREYANTIANIVSQWVPLTYAAYKNYSAKAVTLSNKQLEVFRHYGSIDAVIRNSIEAKSVFSISIREIAELVLALSKQS